MIVLCVIWAREWRAGLLAVGLMLVALVAGCAQDRHADQQQQEPNQLVWLGADASSGAPSDDAVRPAQFGEARRHVSNDHDRDIDLATSASMFVDTIRVRLVEWCGETRLRVTVPGTPVRAFAGEQAQPIELPLAPGTHEIRAGESGHSIHVGRFEVRTNLLRLDPPGGGGDESTMFALATLDEPEATPVRGSLTLRVTRGGHLEPIITLDMLAYVAGSLLAEMPASFGEEALRAQAVAIRTFTSYRVLANRAGGTERPFDVQSSVADLRYGGTPYERPISWRVARDTADEVLTYNGELFPTFFHSTSGGTTISSASYFGGDFAGFPPLAGGIASPSEASPLHSWTTTLEWSEVREKLLREGFDAGELGRELHDVRRLFPASLDDVPGRNEADPARRPHSFALVTDAGTVRITAPRLRAIVGGGRNAMPSTCCTIRVRNNTLTLRGHGFGHGVGLCQYGAGALGQAGTPYSRILKHYYPQSHLVRPNPRATR